jgi:NADH-quinone oxidoreductase subunit L
MTHAFFKALLFLGAGSVIHALSGEQDMRKMGGIWKKIPVTYAMMWIGSLALAGIGIPGVMGMAGFYSKDVILESAWAAGVTHHQAFGVTAWWLGVIAAFMTAFYSWRLLLLTFHGTFRGDHHALDHAHESPWIMLGPLVPLALGAVLAGKLGYDLFVGEGMEGFWRGSILMNPYLVTPEDIDDLGTTLHFAHHVPAWVAWAPLAAALAGILLAYVFYVMAPGLPAKTARGLGFVYRLVLNKYYVDDVYDYVFLRKGRQAMRAVGALLWKNGDDGLLDGPNGLAAVVRWAGRRVSAIETGYVYHYAFAMVIGLAGLATWFLFRV